MALGLNLGSSNSSLANTAQSVKLDKVYLTSCLNNQPCTTENKDVTIDDKVILNAVVEAHENGRQVYFSDSKDLVLDGRKIDPKLVKTWDKEKPIEIKWYKVENTERHYSNWNLGKFRWDTPKYKENKFRSSGSLSTETDSHPTDKDLDVNKGLGTMRYKAVVKLDDQILSTPGAESTDEQGITNNVHRLSFRLDNSFIGWITSFFNLPYIYGSEGKREEHQSERYIGADCADLITLARRKTGHKIDYTNVKGLLKFTHPVEKGRSFYGKDIKLGDLVFFGEIHVGVLYEDKSPPDSLQKGGPNHILDGYDLIIHTLLKPATVEPIRNYDSNFTIRKWN